MTRDAPAAGICTDRLQKEAHALTLRHPKHMQKRNAEGGLGWRRKWPGGTPHLHACLQEYQTNCVHSKEIRPLHLEFQYSEPACQGKSTLHKPSMAS